MKLLVLAIFRTLPRLYATCRDAWTVRAIERQQRALDRQRERRLAK